MSWMLAFVAAPPTARPPDLAGFARSRIRSVPTISVTSENFTLFAGGPAQTCLSGALPPSTGSEPGGWLVLGLGIILETGGCRLLKGEDWAQFLSSDNPDLEAIEGHFVACRWRNGDFRLFTDRFGLRTVYAAKCSGGVAFSTKLDWLAALAGKAEIDFAEFGTAWLTFNQLSHASLLKGIVRIGPRGFASVRRGEPVVRSSPWTPEISDAPIEEIEKTLISLVKPGPLTAGGLTLGLSGGLDSRLLLSMLLTHRESGSFSLHSFGSPLEPDVAVAADIARAGGIPHRVFDEPPPSPDVCLGIAREFVLGNLLASPASTSLRLRYYPHLATTRSLMIDGGNGEICRRQYLNRLVRGGGRTSLERRNSREFLSFVSLKRADIFTEDAAREMRRGAERQIAEMFDHMPPPEKIGAGNFADLLIVRYRLPNYAGHEQARMDGQLASYMPFAQPSYIRASFSVPPHEKRNARLYRRLIHARQEWLTRFPLVKGTVTYPFSFGTLPAHAWTRLKSGLGMAYHDPGQQAFLNTLKDAVMDITRSSSVRGFAPYDQGKILSLAERFYRGDARLAPELDWWLTFELWRSSLAS